MIKRRTAPSERSQLSFATVDAARLTDQVLLVVASGPDLPGLDVEIFSARSGPWTAVPNRRTCWPANTTGDSLGYLFACHMGVGLDGTLGAVRVRDSLGFTSTLVEPGAILDDLKTLLREHLACLSPETRSEIVRFLGETAERWEGRSNQVCEGMFQVREALRERRQCSVIAADRPLVVNVDQFLSLSERTYFISGWLRDVEGTPTRLTAVAPEGSMADLWPRAWLHPRPDLGSLFRQGPRPGAEGGIGFVCQFELPALSRRPDGWLLELWNESGSEIEAQVPRAEVDDRRVLEQVLGHLSLERLPSDDLRSRHIRPAVSALLSKQQDTAAIGRTATYGMPPREPSVTMIVPLYGRIDLIEHQMAQFAADRELMSVELIYVLDSPELDNALAELVPHLFQLYGIPFRTISMQQNVGFAVVNNMAAAEASGRLVLLMNSDVLPSEPGWLSTMVQFYDDTPSIGALGPKLLFEDDTLQHAGMYFAELPTTRIWDNRHYFKGLDRRLPAANVTRPVPAVTAACMLIDRVLYRDMGGLSGEYIQGDYEDSDLCLRLSRSGRVNWYLPEVELYHLEGLSYPSSIRERNSNYNRWFHSHLWGAEMRTIMQRTPAMPSLIPGGTSS
jgi:GT2 family glycosyltransferase